MSYSIREGPVPVTSIGLRPIKVSRSLENFTMTYNFIFITMDTFENT